MIKLNGVEIKPTIFPDGTSQVWKIPEAVLNEPDPIENFIEWEFESEAEFIHLAQLCDLIEARGGHVDCLYIPYFPYARQDKVVSNNTTFAKKTFTRLLNNLPGIRSVESDDIHSNIFNPDRFKWNNEHVAYNKINEAFIISEATMVCFPDRGALIRYNDLPRYTNCHNHCSFTKVRNQDTGRIERLDLNELVDIKGQIILIVDDLADGGMTFKLTAEKLLTLGANEVMLYTTHGIYSKGIETLRDSGISRIFNRKGEVQDESVPTPPKGMIESEAENM